MKEEQPDAAKEKGKLSFSRREFLQATGGGIVIFFTFGNLAAQERRPRGFQELPTDFNAYLRIQDDGRVTCFTGKVELGQGVMTSLAQMLAEELDVPVSLVDKVMGDTDLCPWDAVTAGSRTTRFFGPALRAAGAEAKAVLLNLAAERLGVHEEQLQVQDGVVIDRNNSARRVTYAQLSGGKTIQRHLSSKAPLNPIPKFSVIGRDFPRKDVLEKVTGKAQYAGDIRLPGMLYARILRPPAHGARLKSVDTSELKNIKGIQIIQDRDLVAVLHAHTDVAEEALSRIRAQYDVPEARVDSQTIYQHLLDVAPPGDVVTEEGSIQEGEKLAAEFFEASYFDHYIAHAPIETHTALARVDKDKATVWASTQRPFGIKEGIAEALGVPAARVRVIAPYVGGGFGGKSNSQQAVEAARLAKLTGKPVQAAWTREEEFFLDIFRPAAVVRIKSGATPAKQVVVWAQDVYFAGPRGAGQIYHIPHHRELSHGHHTGQPGAHPFATGPWRAPGSNLNTFARESHINVMAAKLGVDPLEFRLQNLKDERMEKVLQAAAAKFGWKASKTPSGRGFGLACAIDAGAYVATMVEVEVDRHRGAVRVKRIVHAQEMGLVIHPEGVRQQMEGALTMGLGYSLTEEVHFKGGQIFDRNFDTYQIPRFSWVPRIDTVLLENLEVPAQGGGEPPIVCIGGSIANAIFDATGARLFDLPMTAERVKKALAGK